MIKQLATLSVRIKSRRHFYICILYSEKLHVCVYLNKLHDYVYILCRFNHGVEVDHVRVTREKHELLKRRPMEPEGFMHAYRESIDDSFFMMSISLCTRQRQASR